MEFRKHICEFIDKRDGMDGDFKANPDNIFMTNGASQAVNLFLEVLLADENWYVCNERWSY
jgi:aspartate/methionine/tyrosine aminotransferase